ncbi:MAG: purine-nucleoside phosphorylase [Verrucomicrobia bacterium]|nr:purine-nucleoside phosphorylase [Verrucomicrobiota bacterium]
MSWQNFHPQWGVVLGSGLGGFSERMEVEARVPYAEIAGLPQSRVAGHAGEFVFGKISGVPIVAARGRVHLYEGRSAPEITAHVRWMADCGIRRLVLTNAAGTCNPQFAPGLWMMLGDHLNLTGTSPLLGGANFFDMSEVYSKPLRTHFSSAAKSRGMVLHEGVYAGLLGPQYETPAEVRMLQRLGADAVGMSTVLEAIQARALGLEVAGFSCLTNWAAGLNAAPLAHAEVMETGAHAAAALADLLEHAIPTA